MKHLKPIALSFLCCLLNSAYSFADELEEPPIQNSDREHWAFRPLQSPPLPTVSGSHTLRNGIDPFIVDALQDKDLGLNVEADKRTLIRRLAFDLTGLPPSEEEIQAFESNSQPNAYHDLVERYLASPHYGERWAQHWLDLARFAESDGFEHDIKRKNAWLYRDWVIQAFNEDLPYDQFVQAQIAGDEMTAAAKNRALGTGFLLAGPDMPDINLTAERRHNVLNEITSTVGAVFTGLGVGCAQCHDHKFDPISQADFYRLRAFFDNMAFPQKNKQLGHVFSENETDRPQSYLAVRGDFRREGPLLTAGFPRIMNPTQERPQITPLNKQSSYRRTALARWLTHDKHPLTSRVIVNRLWQHHFGKALVATPNDFGTQGAKPSHPRLLDYLASELVRHDWSLKQMHRLILHSASYRQSSRGSGSHWERALEKDPDNRLFSRMNRRRLTGETLRDAMLASTGSLNLRQGGPSDRPPLPAEVHATLLRKNHWETSTNLADHYRRSIYIFVRRNLRYPMFDVFDRPDANASCARRSQTTTAPQSLNLLNSEFSLACAKALSKKVQSSHGSIDSRVRHLFLKVLNRAPNQSEHDALKQFIETSEIPLEQALTEASLALYNLNEFLYID